MEERGILFDSRFLFRYSVSMIRYVRAAHMEDWESVRGHNHFGAVKIITANVRLFLVLVARVFCNVIIFACCVVVLVLRDLQLMLVIFLFFHTEVSVESLTSTTIYQSTQILGSTLFLRVRYG